jgi:predicted SprT family Zn-dependent metalloprotease
MRKRNNNTQSTVHEVVALEESQKEEVLIQPYVPKQEKQIVTIFKKIIHEIAELKPYSESRRRREKAKEYAKVNRDTGDATGLHNRL